MKLTIDNVFCFQFLEEEIRKGANLITGQNSSGKTSMATILRALSTCEDDPLLLGSKKAAYISDGSGKGMARLDECSWVPTEGFTKPKKIAVPHAVGMDLLGIGQSENSKRKIWLSIFMPEEIENVLKGEAVEMFTESDIQDIITNINETNWDAYHLFCRNQLTELRGDWSKLAGQKYGTSKAVNWQPEGYQENELTGATEESLQKELEEANNEAGQLAHSIRITADQIEEAKRTLKEDKPDVIQALTELNSKYQGIVSAESTRTNKIEKLREKAAILRTAVADHIPLDNHPGHSCPKCSAPLSITHKGIEEWIAPTMEQITQHNEIKESQELELKSHVQVGKSLAKELNELAAQKQQCVREDTELKAKLKAFDQYAKIANKLPSQELDQERKQAIIERQAAAGNCIRLFNIKKAVDRVYKKIKRMERREHLLGPKGVMKSLVDKGFDALKTNIKTANDLTEWKHIGIDDTFSITSNGRPIQLTAANEKLKAQWLLQISSALATQSKVIILDCADTLRGESWDGMVRLVNRLREKAPHIHVVVCATSGVGNPEGWNVINLDLYTSRQATNEA